MKKILHRIRLSLKVLRMGVIPLPEQNCIVLVIEEKSDILNISIGITHERAKELIKIIQTEHQAYDRLSDALHAISKQCKHPNELAWCSMQLAANIHEQFNGGGFLGGLLARICGKDDDDK